MSRPATPAAAEVQGRRREAVNQMDGGREEVCVCVGGSIGGQRAGGMSMSLSGFTAHSPSS